MALASRPSGIMALIIAIAALLAPVIYRIASPSITKLSPYLVTLASLTFKTSSQSTETVASSFSCLHHPYTTEIVSVDPLVIYIESFLTSSEIKALLEAGEPAFGPSRVYKSGHNQDTQDRTSSSAGLPRDNPAVECVLARAEAFLGTMLDPSRDDIGPPQLVRYTAGQRFNRHHDWYDRPQPTRRGMPGRGRSWNRIASFFAILEDHCKGGETWFPFVNTTAFSKTDEEGRQIWRNHEDGGLAFRPVAGNALFWVNLFQNNTGDRRTIHAGLPVTEGLKIAMNIWPRKFYT
ncbi:uncharacterized protein F4812DRAFT_205641 [Daldinia caldariorum]|uniref:uncharacterized protein n=1 Tax=Daldinia caldariorum TaxID=326644 RepID=UPI002008D01F|nr:uncharacterized protein F4812DRAFT_205641 [Daldinia caldariorum]KAI1472122.1 hypothetical protein F4812DRAFT_205641 [Daldinia caldariorum]